MNHSTKRVAGFIAAACVSTGMVGCATKDPAPQRSVLLTENATYSIPYYSPDGSRLLYVRTFNSKSALYVANADGTNPKRVGAEAPYVVNGRWSSDGKLIGYTSDIDGPPDIYIVPAEGGDVRRTTRGVGLEYITSFRKGTDEILYYDTKGGESDLYSLNLKDSTVTQLTKLPGDEDGQWSPDGKRLAFSRGLAGKSTLWVMEPGKEPVQLTKDGYETYQDWSADGSLIAYTSIRNGRRDVWVIPATGGTPRQLTNDIRDDWAPEFSPDGKWIAYLSDRGGQQDLWVVPVEGGESIRVTNDPGSEGRPAWTADGSALTFSYDENRAHLWVVPTDSGAPRQLTTGSEDDHSPLVSPDGKQVAFISHRAGSADIFVVPLTGGEPVPITTESTDENNFSWSPDGTKILFDSRRGGTTSLFVVPATGGTSTKLLDWTDDQLLARWSPDGKLIAFNSTRQSNSSDIWVVNADGSNPRRLTTNARANGALWSPDGRTIVFVQANAQGESNPFSIPVGGGTPTKIPFEGYAGPVEFSKTGDLLMVGFARGSATRFDAYVYRGGKVETILADPDNDFCVAWSPDGKTVACITLKTGQTEISIVPAAGGPSRIITTSFAEENLPVFTPDGKSIVYQAAEVRNQIVTVKVQSLLRGTGKAK